MHFNANNNAGQLFDFLFITNSICINQFCLGCPGVTYNFPNANQVTDYVRYQRYVPRMAEVTVCVWIKTAGFRNEVESVISYAVRSTDNELQFHFDGSSGAFFYAGG